MTFRIFLTILEMVLFVLVLGLFLHKIATQLNSISRTLSKITFGVRAVETQCLVIGPAVSELNPVLSNVAAGMEQAAMRAERRAG